MWNKISVCLMVFNATFKNISVISWQSVLLVEETSLEHRSPKRFWSKWSVPERYDVALCCNDTSFDISQTGDKKDIIPDEWKIRLAYYIIKHCMISSFCRFPRIVISFQNMLLSPSFIMGEWRLKLVFSSFVPRVTDLR